MSKLSALTIRRKLLHILFGSLLLAGLQFQFLDAKWLGGLLLLGAILSLAARRWPLPLISFGLTQFGRPGEWPGLGALTFTAGAWLTVLLFPPAVALAAVAILTVGDGVSALVGPFGRVRTRLSQVKLLEGTLAGSVLGGAAATLFLPAEIAFLAAAVAMLVEAVEIRLHRHFLDDNLTVPLAAGTTALLLQHLLPV